MAPELLQVGLLLVGVVGGWIARHNGLGAPATPATPATPPATPAAPIPPPKTIGHGEVIAWLVQQANVDLPKLLQLMAQAAQPQPKV